jgi:hypothetical protein
VSFFKKITKKDIGKRFFVTPTGSNWCRSKGTTSNQPKEIVLTDMRRTRGEFKFIESGFDIRFSISEHSHTDLSLHLDSGYNSGYHLFSSLEDCETVKKAKIAKDFISDSMRFDRFNNIPKKNVIEAARLLGWVEQLRKEQGSD